MTGQEIVDKYNKFTDDTTDSILVLQIANDAIHEIESELEIPLNELVDSSQSTSVGQTYATAKTMPTLFESFSKPYIYVGRIKYYGVPLADAVLYRDTPYKYYYDPSDGLHLCGRQNAVQTISIPYRKASADITLATSPIWPTRFHGLIPLYMAVYYYPIDGGEKERSWADTYNTLLEKGKDRFRDYVSKMRLAEIGGRTLVETDDGDPGLPLEMM